MDNAHIETMARKHAAIDAQLDTESHRPFPDMILVNRLKKEKLRLKDGMAGHFH